MSNPKARPDPPAAMRGYSVTSLIATGTAVGAALLTTLGPMGILAATAFLFPGTTTALAVGATVAGGVGASYFAHQAWYHEEKRTLKTASYFGASVLMTGIGSVVVNNYWKGLNGMNIADTFKDLVLDDAAQKNGYALQLGYADMNTLGAAVGVVIDSRPDLMKNVDSIPVEAKMSFLFTLLGDQLVDYKDAAVSIPIETLRKAAENAGVTTMDHISIVTFKNWAASQNNKSLKDMTNMANTLLRSYKNP